MRYNLIIKEEADWEISDAYWHYEMVQSGLGEKFLLKLEEYFIRIYENPEHYQVKKDNFREAYLRRFPYLIIYEIENQSVIVYSVFLCHRNPAKKPSQT